MTELTETPNSVPRFKRHVGFDNLPAGEATKFNTSSLTLNVRHQGYHPRRRSRTFMVGVDEHAYSDYALVWLLENLVDDGDEVVCVRVIETPVRGADKSYQEEAKKMMQTITEKNTQNRAISIILEYSVGKLHATFQQLIQMYQPSMLIVGTRGRSLGGIQGLVNNRNSFSKYCLQYSPVPVVVVRPDDKRKKKKEKRSHDPSRQSYVSMLSSNEGVHEADKGISGLYETETQIPPEEEAHQVAAALGLPAAFDPTIKPLQLPALQSPRNSASSLLGSSASTTEAPVAPPALERRSSTPPPLRANDDSGDEDSGGEDEEEQFDIVSGQQALKSQREREQLAMQAQKERLHRMEVGEAAALLKSGSKINEEDEDEEDEASSQGSGSANRRRSA
ncbi:hypothetical protein BR93DRAFT_935457 [Coniochaeta sp. PMI_546]|nr:hypothetical protein BR93DRAFT_935457 [Coniochaeta sp. PMI_546]